MEQEKTDFSVPNPQHENAESPEFIHDATFEEDVRDNIQFNTYIKAQMEGKPHIPTTLWTYSDMASGHMTSPVFSDTPTNLL